MGTSNGDFETQETNDTIDPRVLQCTIYCSHAAILLLSFQRVLTTVVVSVGRVRDASAAELVVSLGGIAPICVPGKTLATHGIKQASAGRAQGLDFYSKALHCLPSCAVVAIQKTQDGIDKRPWFCMGSPSLMFLPATLASLAPGGVA